MAEGEVKLDAPAEGYRRFQRVIDTAVAADGNLVVLADAEKGDMIRMTDSDFAKLMQMPIMQTPMPSALLDVDDRGDYLSARPKIGTLLSQVAAAACVLAKERQMPVVLSWHLSCIKITPETRPSEVVAFFESPGRPIPVRAVAGPKTDGIGRYAENKIDAPDCLGEFFKPGKGICESIRDMRRDFEHRLLVAENGRRLEVTRSEELRQQLARETLNRHTAARAHDRAAAIEAYTQLFMKEAGSMAIEAFELVQRDTGYGHTTCYLRRTREDWDRVQDRLARPPRGDWATSKSTPLDDLRDAKIQIATAGKDFVVYQRIRKGQTIGLAAGGAYHKTSKVWQEIRKGNVPAHVPIDGNFEAGEDFEPGHVVRVIREPSGWFCYGRRLNGPRVDPAWDSTCRQAAIPLSHPPSDAEQPPADEPHKINFREFI